MSRSLPSRGAIAVLASGFALASALFAQEPIVRTSVGVGGVEGDGSSSGGALPGLSADGRWVVFQSVATNLVAGDSNGFADIFVRDLVANTTTRVSVSSMGAQADGNSEGPTISGDGRFVVFTSSANNLVAGGITSTGDIYLHDRDPDGNGLFDEGNGTTELVSVSTSGSEANGYCWFSSISDDGNLIAFVSGADNLIPVDNNAATDIFLRNRTAGTTTRVSIDANNKGGNSDSDQGRISRDGNFIAFISRATNLPGTANVDWEVFLRDRKAGTTVLVSTDAQGNPGDDQAFEPAISSDGRYVAFRSGARNLWPGSGTETAADLFVKDMQSGAVECASLNMSGQSGAGILGYCDLSADGRRALFSAGATDLVPNDLNGDSDFYIRDLDAGTTTCVTIDCTGSPVGNFHSIASMSPDARFVAFTSQWDGFVADDTNGTNDVFVHDLANGGLQASWSNYGSGWPGTKGVPTIVLDRDPEFGATIRCDVSNSWGFWTVGFLFIGLREVSVPTNRGGTLLVDPFLLTYVVIPPGGWSDTADVPWDSTLCGAELDVQMLEVDPGASYQFSFTPGLKLIVGR